MSLPQYTSYKDSAVEWLGPVPASWGVRRIRHLFEIRKRICGAEGPPVLSITQQGIKVKDLESGDGQLAADYSKYQFVQVGDFAMNHMDLLTGYVDISPLFGVTSPDYRVFAIRDNGMCCDRYYLYLFQAGYRNKIFFAYGQGSSQLGRWRFPTDEFNNFECPFPPLHEQIAIAAFLDRETAKIDALVAEQQRLIALLNEKRQAVISHTVAKGLNPDAPMKDSGIEWLGEVPKHWTIKRLRLVAEVQGGIAKGKDVSGCKTVEVPYLRVANVQDGYLDLDEISTIEIVETELERYLLRPGDVLMNEGGDYDKLGRGAIWRGQIPCCIHQNHVFAVRPKALSPEWLNEVTGSAYAQFYFMTRSKQSTNLASISSTNIMELPVVLPPEPEQQQILTFIREHRTKLDPLIAEAESAIALLQERRTALISAAVTGKIDVRGLVTKEAAA